jgi:hypothetical protein
MKSLRKGFFGSLLQSSEAAFTLTRKADDTELAGARFSASSVNFASALAM